MDDDDGSTTSTPQGDEVEMIPAASARENGEGYGGEFEGTPPGEEGRRGRRRRRDDDGDTMVTKAVKRGDIEGVTDALKQSGRVNAKKDQGQTPLAIACRMGQASIVTMLLWKFGADANITFDADNKWTPLHHAIWNVHKEVVQLLLSAEAIEVNKANKHGMTPLHLACGCGDIDMLKIVVQAPGVDVNLRNWYGETPLLTACACGNVEVVKVLLSAPGIDVDKPHHALLRSPLWIAAGHGNPAIVKLLLSAGANVHGLDVHGYSALDVACSPGLNHIEVDVGAKYAKASEPSGRRLSTTEREMLQRERVKWKARRERNLMVADVTRRAHAEKVMCKLRPAILALRSAGFPNIPQLLDAAINTLTDDQTIVQARLFVARGWARMSASTSTHVSARQGQP